MLLTVMFSSNGYFKDIKCPYYDLGFCKRPYCQYKHIKSVDGDVNGEVKPSTAELQKLVSDVVDKVFSEKEGKYSECSKILGDRIFKQITSQNSKDIGSNIEKLKEKYSLSNQKKFQAKHPYYLPKIPVYTPTPIKELAKRKYSIFSASKKDGEINSQKSSEIEPSHKRLKFYDEEYNPSSSNYVSEISKTLYDPCNKSGDNNLVSEYNPSQKSDNEITYRPSDSNSCTEPKYVPSGNSGNASSCSYQPSELTVQVKEPSYVPKDTPVDSDVSYNPSSKSSLPHSESNYDPTNGSISTSVSYIPDSKVNLGNEEQYKPKGKESSLTYIPSKRPIKSNDPSDTKVIEKLIMPVSCPSVVLENHQKENLTDPFRDDLDDCIEKILSKKIEKNSFELFSENNFQTDESTLETDKSKDKPIHGSQVISSSLPNDEKKISEPKKALHSHSSKSKHRHHKSEEKHKSKHHKENSHHKTVVKSKHHSKESSKDKLLKKKNEGEQGGKTECRSTDKSECDSKSKHEDKHKQRPEGGHRKKHSSHHKKKSEGGRSKTKDTKSTSKSPKVSSNKDSQSKRDESKHSRLKERKNKETPQDALNDFDKMYSTLESFKPCDSDFNEFEDEADENVEIECRMIFEEYESKPSEAKCHEVITDSTKSSESVLNSGKKRVAHQPGCGNLINPPAKSIVNRPSAAQIMHERWMSMQQSANSETANHSKSFGGKKCRIAAVPYASSLINAKSQINSTVAQTIKKGVSRVAHTPSVVSAERPKIPLEFGSKIPPAVRQNYLNIIIDECLKHTENEQEAYSRALEEEKDVYSRSSNKKLYCSLAALAISKLRKSVTSNTANKVVSHLSILAGKGGEKCSWSIEKTRRKSFEETSMYSSIKQYILTETQLRDNGYPRSDSENNSKARFYKEFKKSNKNQPTKPFEKICERCNENYRVDELGVPLNEKMCVFHYGRAYKRKGKTGWDTKYSCCGGELESSGCVYEKYHVNSYFDSNNQWGYVKTFGNENDREPAIYALDCEMCYTTVGSELTRITVVDTENKSVYETFVKPENPILDYNTRFSGITENHLKTVQTTLRDVQAVLLSIFKSDTILIGHSLESDLIALKLIHDTVVDTSLVFPHRLGSDFKRSLKNLSADYLKRIIQDDVGGHDSAEDAIACMDLMKWKLKDDAKTKSSK